MAIFNNVYVKNLSESTTEEDLKSLFGEYGELTSVVVMRDGDGKSKCFGFANFENPEDAAKAVEALNGKKFDDQELYVGKAQKKYEREQQLKLNLYVKNIDDSITDDKLKELFSEFGTIASCKVMRDPSGQSTGTGFVAFTKPEEVSRAISEMNGRMVVSKPLYVAVAQRKEERRAKLQASLYVGDLDFNVMDSQVYDLFSEIGRVESVRVCRDLTTGRSLGYGYVNYSLPQDAAKALDALNFTSVNGKPIRIMYSHRDPSIRRNGAANIFIKNLDKAIDHKSLHETFSLLGNILSSKLATDPSGQSKGYAFVQYDSEESAQYAIDTLNGMLINDKLVYIGRHLRKQERESSSSMAIFNNVYVQNLSESTTEEDLNSLFGEYGELTSVVVMRDGDGKSKCGFVNFKNPEDAAKAVEALNGKKFDDQELYVGKAQKKYEREQELKLNLYVKNIDDSITDDKLKELFSEFGTIASCKVMRDPSGQSTGTGFVAFTTPEEVSRAISEMNGRMVVSKPLYVAVAQRKEERRAKLQINNPNVGVAGPGGVVANQFVPKSLYVGDLDFNVTESQVYELFSQIGQVVSVRVCRDLTTGRSLGYGYVNYSLPQDAAKALDALNFTSVNGKPIRIMYSHRDPSIRRNGAANIFIKNLDKAIDHKSLHDTFSSFGNILSCKLVTDPSGQSKGYGFVQFESEESAQKAIDKLNGMPIYDKEVYVGRHLRKQEREPSSSMAIFNNVFVKNLSESTTEEDLKSLFGEHGALTSVVVMRNGDGKSKCFGFVNFENPEDAAKAVEALNGKKFDDKELYVGKAQKKYEREQELKGRFEQTLNETVDNNQGLNLYVKNIDDSITDDKLKELFSEFGTIASCKVMRDPSGQSRGTGFVTFTTPEEVSRAISEMNGRMVVSKPLYVAVAQRKEERRAKLQAQFSQMRPVAMTPSVVAPRVQMYPPGAPGMGQQVFYGRAPPTLMPPQIALAGFGYHQQLMPGMRPGGAPMPNFMMPMVQQGQRSGGRRPAQQSQQPMPLMQQQMLPWGRVYRYPPGRNMQEVPMAGVAGGMLSAPYDMTMLREAHVPMPVTALVSQLANSTPDQQRMMLGEALYFQVDQLQHESAAKVTGMLLEMDKTEVLHLLESPEALKAKVEEAMEVLQYAAA